MGQALDKGYGDAGLRHNDFITFHNCGKDLRRRAGLALDSDEGS